MVWQWYAWAAAVGDGSKEKSRFASCICFVNRLDTLSESSIWNVSSLEHGSCSASDHESKRWFDTPPTVLVVVILVGVEEHAHTHTPIASRQWEPNTQKRLWVPQYFSNAGVPCSTAQQTFNFLAGIMANLLSLQRAAFLRRSKNRLDSRFSVLNIATRNHSCQKVSSGEYLHESVVPTMHYQRSLPR